MSYFFPDDEGSWKCNVDELKERKNLLQKYIDANTSLEVQALYAVQALFVKKGHPPGTLLLDFPLFSLIFFFVKSGLFP